MSKISKSPERMTFQAKSYQEKLMEDPTNRNARAMVEMWQKWREEAVAIELNEDWQKNNLEYDLRTCEPILIKVRNSDRYAQNLYAALCNMQYLKLEVIPVLKEEYWSCSWRHAGGIVADMRQQGDYIDWYCSGIGDGLGNGDPDGVKGYIAEGAVTDEIKEDLKQLGWLPVEWDDDK
jgi:hypothetical protein